jgi:hypothetical protein
MMVRENLGVKKALADGDPMEFVKMSGPTLYHRVRVEGDGNGARTASTMLREFQMEKLWIEIRLCGNSKK